MTIGSGRNRSARGLALVFPLPEAGGVEAVIGRRPRGTVCLNQTMSKQYGSLSRFISTSAIEDYFDSS
jgi:hypothetical protein